MDDWNDLELDFYPWIVMIDITGIEGDGVSFNVTNVRMDLDYPVLCAFDEVPPSDERINDEVQYLALEAGLI